MEWFIFSRVAIMKFHFREARATPRMWNHVPTPGRVSPSPPIDDYGPASRPTDDQQPSTQLTYYRHKTINGARVPAILAAMDGGVCAVLG